MLGRCKTAGPGGVQCLNDLFSLVSTSWQPSEGMVAEEAAFGLLSVWVEKEKSHVHFGSDCPQGQVSL